MHLRTKLILAFFYLVTLILLTAASAGVGLNQVFTSVSEVFGKSELWLAETRRLVIATPDDEVRDLAIERLEVYENGLNAFRDEQRSLVLANGIQLGFVVTIALLTLTFISIALQRDVLFRLLKLRRFSEALLRGERHLRISLSGSDELTLLGRLLNASLDRQEELQAELKGKMGQQRLMVMALMRAFGKETMLISHAGEVLVSTFPVEMESAIQAQQDKIQEWLAEQKVVTTDERLSYQQSGLALRLTPVGPQLDNVTGYIVEMA